MNIVRKIQTTVVSLVMMMTWATVVCAQRASSLRITEIMTRNESSIVDEYGNRGAWIELYNPSSASVDIKGCYLTDNPNNLKKYRIPTWCTNTGIVPGGYMILWVDGSSDKGFNHLNFSFDADKENEVFFVDTDGQTVINSVKIPLLESGHSYIATYSDDNICSWSITEKPSPLSPNKQDISSSKVENLQRMDSTGLIMTVVSVAVVFLALALLYIVFSLLGKVMQKPIKVKKKEEDTIVKNQAQDVDIAISMALSQHLSSQSEDIAAISMALNEHLNMSLHDYQDMRLTIRRKSSQWNNKVFGLRKY